MLVMCSTSLPASVPHFCDGDGDGFRSSSSSWMRCNCRAWRPRKLIALDGYLETTQNIHLEFPISPPVDATVPISPTPGLCTLGIIIMASGMLETANLVIFFVSLPYFHHGQLEP